MLLRELTIKLGEKILFHTLLKIFQMDCKSRHIKQVYKTTRRKHQKHQNIHVPFFFFDVQEGFLSKKQYYIHYEITQKLKFLYVKQYHNQN